MAEEKLLDDIEGLETNQRIIQKEKLSFQNFFKDKRNIFALVSVVCGLIAIILFLFLPAILIDLTSEGKDLAKLNAATLPEMANYGESFSGLQVILGGITYSVYHNVGTSAVLENQQMALNIPLLIGLVLILAGIVMVAVMTLLQKSNVLNKVILGLILVGSIVILLSPIWFYLVNPITASTRYNTQLTIYEYGSINGHSGVGSVIGALFGIASSVFAGLLIVKVEETR